MLAVPASTAVSGMNAAQAGLRTSAHNIANLGTEGFRRQHVVAAEGAHGGVTTTVNRSDTAGASLETDVVGLLQSKNAFLANLSVFRTSDRMMGSLLDIAA